jgi:SAM-dependent methyltransferase
MSAAAAIWHDVECGGYGADLELWEELAEGTDRPILDLGCGTGRVSLHLARRGHPVIALDRDPELIEALRERAADLAVEPLHADARDFSLDRQVGLALAPMQLMQMLPGREDRLACLGCVRDALTVGGQMAAALVEELPEADGELPPLPDVREVDGWVYSSLPVEATLSDGEIVLRRLRQTVSPAGELSEEEDVVRICALTASQLEAEAREAGLVPLGRRAVDDTEAHVGSAVVVLERGA